MSEDQEHTEELSTFVEEVRDGLYHLWTALNPEDQEFHPTPELIRENFVIAHRIKGTSLLFDLPGIADLAAELETLLSHRRADRRVG